MRLPLLELLASAFLAGLPCHALIFYGLDNSANGTHPGSGVPFDAVARVAANNTPASIGELNGSAVHLGGGYLLTANHVDTSIASKTSFDGITWYDRDPLFAPVQVAANTDLKIYRLGELPAGIPAASILTLPLETTAPAVIVGWGRGRNPAVALESAVVGWGNFSTAGKRWGLNRPHDYVDVDYQSGTYEAIRTFLWDDSHPASLGELETAVLDKDSGSPMFQLHGGTWYVIGIATGVSTLNSSTFGNTVGTSDANYFARVSVLSDQILAIVPEPASYLLALCSLLAGSLLARR